LLLRSTEIRPHRPNDLLPPSNSQTPGCSPAWPSTLGVFPHLVQKESTLPGLNSGVPLPS